MDMQTLALAVETYFTNVSNSLEQIVLRSRFAGIQARCCLTFFLDLAIGLGVVSVPVTVPKLCELATEPRLDSSNFDGWSIV